MTNLLNNFCLIFENTTHPGNLGSIARAAKNMGILDVRLVNPIANPHDEHAIAVAAGAADILENVKVYTEFSETIADCQLVLATSARIRTLNPRIILADQIVDTCMQHFQQISTTQAEQFLAGKVKVAVLFGTEHSGLPNDRLLDANYHIVIDSNPEYTSLNLAMACLLICYAIRSGVSRLNQIPSNVENIHLFETKDAVNPDDHSGYSSGINNGEEFATNAASLMSYINRFTEHYTNINFIQHDMIIPRIKQMLHRYPITNKELDLLQGLLTANIKKIREQDQEIVRLKAQLATLKN